MSEKSFQTLPGLPFTRNPTDPLFVNCTHRDSPWKWKVPWLVEYGFYRLNLRRVDPGVFEEHRSAVRCYQKVGLKIEGCMREQMWQDGKYKNGLRVGLLRSEYKPFKADQGK